MKDYYRLLDLTPAASLEEIKRAFRQQIARYHPDKVQHLGREFQVMAADRAAELTEAYHVLSDASRRSAYNAARSAEAAALAPPAAGDARAASPASSAAPDVKPTSARHSEASAGTKVGPQFVEERASRDEFVRQATVSRFRQAFAHVAGAEYDEMPAHGFEFSWIPKAKLFARTRGPRILGRFVQRVDSAAVADAWAAVKLVARAGEETCVILIGSELAPQRELADAIASQRRRPLRGGDVTVIPVSARAWDALLPTDAPALARDLLARLRTEA